MDQVTPNTQSEPADDDVAQLARTIRETTDALLALLPDAYARQWEASPVPKPREDTTERSSGGRPSDPTADTVLDARRLALRGAVSRAERVLLLAANSLGYAVTSVYECPTSVGLDDLRASLSWVCNSVLGADLVVVLPGYPTHGVELALAGALDIPVVDIDEALAVEPERLLA
jgi:hypothetical protein